MACQVSTSRNYSKMITLQNPYKTMSGIATPGFPAPKQSQDRLIRKQRDSLHTACHVRTASETANGSPPLPSFFCGTGIGPLLHTHGGICQKLDKKISCLSGKGKVIETSPHVSHRFERQQLPISLWYAMVDAKQPVLLMQHIQCCIVLLSTSH